MMDRLKICDSSRKLQDRYDDFIRFVSTKNNNVIELLAEDLGVDSSIIDVFFELANLDAEEFDRIDQNKIDIGALFVFIRCSKTIRIRVYDNISTLLSTDQPLKAIREFIDSETPDFDTLINSLSPACLTKISQYLKGRDIDENVLNKQFRSMLFTASKKLKANDKITEKMIDWIIQGITYDYEKDLGVFNNQDLQTNYAEDYNTIESIIQTIKIQVA